MPWCCWSIDVSKLGVIVGCLEIFGPLVWCYWCQPPTFHPPQAARKSSLDRWTTLKYALLLQWILYCVYVLQLHCMYTCTICVLLIATIISVPLLQCILYCILWTQCSNPPQFYASKIFFFTPNSLSFRHSKSRYRCSEQKLEFTWV